MPAGSRELRQLRGSGRGREALRPRLGCSDLSDGNGGGQLGVRDGGAGGVGRLELARKERIDNLHF